MPALSSHDSEVEQVLLLVVPCSVHVLVEIFARRDIRFFVLLCLLDLLLKFQILQIEKSPDNDWLLCLCNFLQLL